MRAIVSGFDIADVRLSYSRMTGDLTNSELLKHLDEAKQELVELRDRQHRMIGVYDFREAPSYTPKQRLIQADWLRSIKPLERAVVIGYAFVTPSIVMRGVITAVNWLAPHNLPQVVHPELTDALSWAFDVCEKNAVSVPEVVRRACQAHFAELTPVRRAASGA